MAISAVAMPDSAITSVSSAPRVPKNSASDSRHVEMIEVELAKGETEHPDRRIDDAFAGERRNEHEALAFGVDNIEEPFAGKTPLGVRRGNTLDLNRRSFSGRHLAEIAFQQDRQCAPFGIHGVPSDHLLGTLYRRFICEAMPNRKYGVFNIKMTNTIKEGWMCRRVAGWPIVSTPPQQ